MPLEIDRRAFFQLSLLLLALPIQHYLSQLRQPTEEEKLESLQTLKKYWLSLKEGLTSSKLYENTLYMIRSLWQTLQEALSDEDGDYDDESWGPDVEVEDVVDKPLDGVNDESPAVEVLAKKYSWSSTGDFASSTKPRFPRPSHVKFRVGQIVKHTKYHYRGVIVGWDEVAKAPKDWIHENHGEDAEITTQPNYAILVDVRDRTVPQLSYVPESGLKLAFNSRISHPNLDDFFEAFDGAQYLPRPWLRTIYPMDS